MKTINTACTPHRARQGLAIKPLAAHANRGRRLGESKRTAQRRRVWLRDGARCADCGGVLAWPLFDLDHVAPLIDGGSADDDNCQLLHRACHRRKSAAEASGRANANQKSNRCLNV